MRTLPLAVCMLLVFAGSARAESDWAASFTSETVASYIVSDEISLLVVPAGEANEERAAAYAAFVQALRSSNRLKSLLTSEPLGEVGQLDDAAIVKKGAHLPVSQIAVVRVMQGSDTEPPTAVVSFYGKDAEAVTALAVQKGAALAASSDTSTPASGANANAMLTVGGLQKKIAEPNKKAKEEYEKNVIWFADFAGVNQAGAVVASWSVPYRGKYREELHGADFYKAVGRDDLASSYSTWSAVRTTLWVSGLFLMVGAAAAPMYPLVSGSLDDMIPALIVGGAATGVGLTAFFTGVLINPHPVSPSEARQLADEHNQRLRQRLGLGESARREEEPSRMKFGFALGPSGGAVSAGFTF